MRKIFTELSRKFDVKCCGEFVYAIIIVLLLIALMQATNSYSQNIGIKVKVSGPKLSEYQILLKDDGKTLNSEFTSRHKTSLKLDFGKDYLVEFRREGFRNKAVAVNTNNVPFYMKYELLDFSFEMTLDQPCVECVPNEDTQVAAYWYFDHNLGEFNYTYDKDEALLRNSSVGEHLVGP